MFSTGAVVAGSRRLAQVCAKQRIRQTSSITPKEPPSESPPHSAESRVREHATSKLDKWLLEHYKKFPKGQAPEYVGTQMMETVRTRARIKFNVYLAIVALIGALFFARQGRIERAQGHSVGKMNLEWHAEVNRKHREELAAKEKSS